MPKVRHGESTRGGLFPLALGGFGGFPLDFYLILSASMRVFNVFLCVWEQISVTIFFLKIYFFNGRVRNQMLDKIVFSQSQFFSYFFLLQRTTA